jgi:predicted thioesterase
MEDMRLTATWPGGKVITFEVNAYDEAGPIGKGTHKRVIVNTQKFLDKTYTKL